MFECFGAFLWLSILVLVIGLRVTPAGLGSPLQDMVQVEQPAWWRNLL
jgi:hypothetical protein